MMKDTNDLTFHHLVLWIDKDEQGTLIPQMLHEEYTHIRVLNADTNTKVKTKKIRKKHVQMTKGYMNSVLSNQITIPPYSDLTE